MIEIITFILGLLVGGGTTYALMRNHCELHGVAAHARKQQSEKQSRKEKILAMIREKGSVTNNDIEKALGVSDASATNYLQELEGEGTIEQIGKHGRFVTYRIKE